MCRKLDDGYGIRSMPITLKTRNELRYYKFKGVIPNVYNWSKTCSVISIVCSMSASVWAKEMLPCLVGSGK